MKNLKKLIVAFIFSGLMAPLAAPVAHGATGGSSKPLSVCTDAEQKPKSGDIDVLLLMDNSKSLESKKNGNTPTDPDGKRFTAVGDLLGSLGSLTESTESQKGVTINFGMIS